MNIQELIALCEGAEGPDRWIDAHIHGVHFNQEVSVNEGGMVLTDHCVLGWIDPGKENINFSPSGIGERMLRYTASVDAAIELAVKLLDNGSVDIEVAHRSVGGTARGRATIYGPHVDQSETGATPALALCLCILKAQKMKEETTDEELPYQCDACSTPGYGPNATCRCSPIPSHRERLQP